jgi:hypothetical protein
MCDIYVLQNGEMHEWNYDDTDLEQILYDWEKYVKFAVVLYSRIIFYSSRNCTLWLDETHEYVHTYMYIRYLVMQVSNGSYKQLMWTYNGKPFQCYGMP